MNSIKPFLFIAVILVLNINSICQSSDKEYKASMDGWEVDIEKAYTQSLKTGKPILANFTGTDWCGWCIRLKRDVFVTDKFKKWAQKNVILLELDFPRKFKVPEKIAKQNSGLQQAFGVRGYPTIWVFKYIQNAQTKQNQMRGLAKTGYVAGGADAWIKDLESKLEQAK